MLWTSNIRGSGRPGDGSGRPLAGPGGLSVQATAVLPVDVHSLGLWTANRDASGRTSNESGGRSIAQPERPTNLLDVRQTHLTSSALVGRLGGVLGVHNRPHFPLMLRLRLYYSKKNVLLALRVTASDPSGTDRLAE